MIDRNSSSMIGWQLAQVLLLGSVLAACSAGEGGGDDAGAGGAAGTGAGGAATHGGTNSMAGTQTFGGSPGSGGVSGRGGASGLGGVASGGAPGSGGALGASGAASGGAPASGGALSGGAPSNGGGTAAASGGSGQGGASGAGTGGSGPCTFSWDPPATWSSNGKTFPTQSDLDAVWDYQTKTDNPSKNQNWIFDQIIANKGSLNYCVRIDLKTNGGGASTVISAAQRAQYQQLLETWLNNWVETWMKGWGCWPYQHVPVNIVGWAVASASTLADTVDPNQAVYVNTLDGDGVPQCPDACYGGSHLNGNYPNCPGGASKHFDLSLWLTYGMGLNGYGYNWGQQVDLDVAKYQHILGHEMGHGFGLPDFYNDGAQDFYVVETGADAKALSGAGFIMQAGSATTVTTFDGWMLRQMWYKFERARHGY